VRPGDHPDFYRLAPPDGRSRESSLVLDRRGRFWHEGALVEHPAMARAFAAWIARHPDDGRYILDNGYDWTYLTVEDAPFTVTAVKSDLQGDPLVVLTDGSEEPLRIAELSLGEGDALYTRVKSGEFDARFTPYAQTQIAPWLVEMPGREVAVEVRGVRYAVPRRDPTSGA
jgi:hypothetical protein